jgi:leucyl-tRNA---protein transferase
MEYYADSLPINQMSESKIDELLSFGWYRMSDRFFTTSFIRFEKTIYNAIWLRIQLSEFEMSKSLKDLKKRNSRFRIEHQKFTIDPEAEALFTKYRRITTFDTMPTLHEHLYQRKAFDKFSYCIKIYEGEMLIACGIYEKGISSMEGLVSFYDDNYQKYSLGKYLILSKIEYAQSRV